MRHVAVVIVVSALISLPRVAASMMGERPQSDSAIARFADDYFGRELTRTHTPGAALVMVRDGRIILGRGYGLADRERRIPVDPGRTLWRLASVSKSFTALATLQLRDRGAFRLDDDVNLHLRRVHLPDAFGAPVTIRELLEHTSGLDDRYLGDGFLDDQPGPDLTATIAERLPRRIRPPGSYLYSNYDYGVLGALVESATGRPFVDYMRDGVLTPLRMTQATFAQPLPAAWRRALAEPYGFSHGTYQRWPVIYHCVSPGGGATATADDMGRYIAYLLADSTPPGLPPSHELREAFAIDSLWGSRRIAMGYGWRARLLNGERVVETTGDLPGYSDLLVLMPEQHLGFFIAQNSGNSALSLGFLWGFLDRFFPAAAHAVEAGRDPSWTVPLGAFAGTYRAARYPHHELTTLAVLGSETHVATASPGEALLFWGARWHRVGPLEFQRETDPLVLTFAREPSGRIVGLDNMERVPWWNTRTVQALCGLIPCAAFIVALAVAGVQASRRPAGGRTPVETRLVRLAAVASAIQLTFVLALGAALSHLPTYALMLGVGPGLRVILALPSLALVATAALIWILIRSRRQVSVRALSASVVFVGVSALFFLFLAHWNLLRGWASA